MIRTFETHQIRQWKELTGKLWEFTPCQGEFANKSFMVATPSCFENYPDFENYRGEAIYKTSFYAQGNIRLEFKGVSHTAVVYLDGKEIASHYNAYTIFDAVIPDLTAGMHTLEIKADNRFSPKSALHIPNDYMSYGGVSRPVVLEQIPDVYLGWVHVTPYRKDGKWMSKAELEIINISDQEQMVDVQVRIAEQKICKNSIHLAAGEKKIICDEICFEHVLEWSMEEPNLYFVTAQISQKGEIIDDCIDRFGFREVTIAGKNILLNGKAVRIKGICRHEDHPQFGCALPFQAIQADLQLIRHLGANSVRTTHYPNDEVFLDLCDE